MKRHPAEAPQARRGRRKIAILGALVFVGMASCASVRPADAPAGVEIFNATKHPLSALDFNFGKGWREALEGKVIAPGEGVRFLVPPGALAFRAWIEVDGHCFGVARQLAAAKSGTYRWTVTETPWIDRKPLEGPAMSEILARDIDDNSYVSGLPQDHPESGDTTIRQSHAGKVAVRILANDTLPASPLALDAGSRLYALADGGISVRGDGEGSGENHFRPYLRTLPALLPLRAGHSYRTQFDYACAVPGKDGFELLYFSPIGGAKNDWVHSIAVNGDGSKERGAELIATLKDYPDYEIRWNVVSQGSIALFGLRVYDEDTLGGFWPVLSVWEDKVFAVEPSSGAETPTRIADLREFPPDLAYPPPGAAIEVGAGTSTFEMAFVPGGMVFPTGIDDTGRARIGKAYWIGRTEVTYRLYSTVYRWATSPERGEASYSLSSPGYPGAIPGPDIPATPDPRTNDLHPVTLINWREAMVFCNALTEWYDATTGANLDCVYYQDPDYRKPLRSTDRVFKVDLKPGSQDDPYIRAVRPGNIGMEGCTASGFRLPTALEWEFAARYHGDRNDDGDILDPGEYYPGTYASGAEADTSDPTATGKVAVYAANSGNFSAPVASKLPNALGLYDMSGNVWEWCFDGTPDAARPVRYSMGGPWNASPEFLRIGGRNYPTLYFPNSWNGMRVALTYWPGKPAIAGAPLRAGTPKTPAPATTTSGDSSPKFDVPIYDFSSDPAGWLPVNQVEGARIEDGTLVARNSGPDPFLVRKLGPGFDGSKWPAISVRMRSTSGKELSLYWTTADSRDYGEDKAIHIPLLADGGFHDYVFDTDSSPSWKGHRISELRVDPVEGGTGGDFAISWIRGLDKSDLLSLARRTYEDGDFEGALGPAFEVMTASTTDPSDRLRARLLVAMSLRGLKRHADAAAAFGAYYAGGGDDFAQRANFADSLYESGNYREAEKQLALAIAAEKDSEQFWWMYYRLADLQNRNGRDPSLIVETASRAIELKPDEVIWAYRIRGEALETLDRFDEAKKDLQTCARLLAAQGDTIDSSNILREILQDFPEKTFPGRPLALQDMLSSAEKTFSWTPKDGARLFAGGNAIVAPTAGALELRFRQDATVEIPATLSRYGSVVVKFALSGPESRALIAVACGDRGSAGNRVIGIGTDGRVFRAVARSGAKDFDARPDWASGYMNSRPDTIYTVLLSVDASGGVYGAVWNDSGAYREFRFDAGIDSPSWRFRLDAAKGSILKLLEYGTWAAWIAP